MNSSGRDIVLPASENMGEGGFLGKCASLGEGESGDITPVPVDTPLAAN